MSAQNATVRVVSTQGQDVIDKTTYVSGDAKTIYGAVPIYGSGVQSLNDFSVTPNNLLSLTMTNTLVSGQLDVKFASNSGIATVNLPPGGAYVWWSGGGFPNPLAACSGQALSGTINRVSGYDTTSSGSYVFDLQAIRDG